MQDNQETLTELVERNASQRPNSTAFIYGTRRGTFLDFQRLTSMVANGLLAIGISDQARFAFLCRNSDYVYEMLYGGAKVRAVAVGINWRLSADEVAYILCDSESRLLFTDSDSLDLAKAAVAKCPLVPEIIVIDAPNVHAVCDYRKWRDGQSDFAPVRAVKPDDVVCQLYTSGTTGRAKGVPITHRNIMEQRRAEVATGPWLDGDQKMVVLVVMPTYHIGGLLMGIIAFHHGAATVVSKTPDPESVIAIIEEHRVTHTFLVPTVIQSLIDHCENIGERIQSLRTLRYGAAPIPPKLLRQTKSMLSCELLQMYGMTETTGAVACLSPEDHDLEGEYLLSCGRALVNVDVCIMDSKGNPVPRGSVGEICVRAASVMKGYWRQPQATIDAFHGDWYRSGDAGYLDEGGYLYLRDRIKDMIISGGENIYPAEIENVLCEHRAVLEAAVIGVPDPRWGESAKAIVVLKAGEVVSEANIIDFIRARIAMFKVPKSVEFVTDLPRNPAGKVLRRELRLRYTSG